MPLAKRRSEEIEEFMLFVLLGQIIIMNLSLFQSSTVSVDEKLHPNVTFFYDLKWLAKKMLPFFKKILAKVGDMEKM